jgi:hypothetical protein
MNELYLIALGFLIPTAFFTGSLFGFRRGIRLGGAKAIIEAERIIRAHFAHQQLIQQQAKTPNTTDKLTDIFNSDLKRWLDN